MSDVGTRFRCRMKGGEHGAADHQAHFFTLLFLPPAKNILSHRNELARRVRNRVWFRSVAYFHTQTEKTIELLTRI